MSTVKLISVLILLLSELTLVDALTGECPSPCINGGVCRQSRSRHEQQPNYDKKKQKQQPQPQGQGQQSIYYCHCPTGYTGTECQIKFVMCKSQADLCFNGDPCLRDIDMDGKTFYHCECDGELSDLSAQYAGSICRHAASTQICHDRSGKSHTDQYYCANSGQCNDRGNGCNCSPAGWSGPHCTVPVNHPYHDFVAVQSKQTKYRKARITFSLTIVAILGLYFLVILFYSVGGGDGDSHRIRAPVRRKQRRLPIPTQVVMEQEMTELNSSRDKSLDETYEMDSDDT